jgi:hypothetical protein
VGTPSCPRKTRGAQFDERGVQREQFVFETETMDAGDFAAAADVGALSLKKIETMIGCDALQ